jgi:hypothetical protein
MFALHSSKEPEGSTAFTIFEEKQSNLLKVVSANLRLKVSALGKAGYFLLTVIVPLGDGLTSRQQRAVDSMSPQ